MVDTGDLKSLGRKAVRVQVPPWVWFESPSSFKNWGFFFAFKCFLHAFYRTELSNASPQIESLYIRSQQGTPVLEFYPQSIYYPREAVEDKYRKGDLRLTENRLIGFVERHRDEILEIAYDESPEPDDDTLLDSVGFFILSKGTIHPPSEMADLIREINREVWYRGEQGVLDTRKVAEEWQEKYAAKWREARLFEAFIVMEHCAATIVDRLRSAACSVG
jgi:hypothetical protein